MTTWTLCPPLTQYAADCALGAHVSRTYLQDNLLNCVEQSGHDVNCIIADGINAMSFATSTSWAWVSEWVPELIPIYQKHGGGWRTLTIGLYAYQTVAFDLRVFLLDTPAAPVIDATSGDVAGVTSYVELSFTDGAWEFVSGTVTPDPYTWIEPEGITPTIGMPAVYAHLARKISSGTGAVMVRNMQISEAY